MPIMPLKCTRKRCRHISSLTRYKRELYRPIWSAPDSSATDSRLRPMWIITSVLWRSKGLVSEIRNRNNSRTHGKPYGNNGPEPTSYHHKNSDINIYLKDSLYIFEIVFHRLWKTLPLLKKKLKHNSQWINTLPDTWTFTFST